MERYYTDPPSSSMVVGGSRLPFSSLMHGTVLFHKRLGLVTQHVQGNYQVCAEGSRLYCVGGSGVAWVDTFRWKPANTRSPKIQPKLREQPLLY
jgi:hypothetical protein